MNEIKDRPVFICGHPKSGTSLLRNLLDFHPQLVVYPEESRFFRNYLPLALNAPAAERIELAKKHLIHIFQWNLENPPAHQVGFLDRDYSWISYSQVETRLETRIKQEHTRHLGDYLSAAILAFGDITSPPDADPIWWVEKTPYNEYFADQIFSWWPEARCIHVLRDPCDNYASYRRKQTDWQPEFFATNWMKSTEAGVRNQNKYGKDRYWMLRFEDIAKQPEKFLGQLLGFLSIEDHPALRTPTRAGLNWQGNSMFNETFAGISTTPVGRWQSELTRNEAAVIQQITKRVAERFGYWVDSPKPFGVLLKAWVWQLRVWVYRLRMRENQEGGP
jgi:hypothetical protein